jgi:hypothetical protein
MKHFKDEAWLDFARRLLPAEQMDRMRAHLESGCKACAALSALWEAVNEAASRQSDYEPAESTVKAVKAAYTARQSRSASIFEGRMARLVFDSLVDAAALAGIRSISSTARHLLYQAGPWNIDVRLDTESARRMSITGQVLVSEAESVSAAHGEVILMRGDTTVAQTSTNEFGEFQFDSDYGSDLRICLQIGGQQPVSLTLPD